MAIIVVFIIIAIQSGKKVPMNVNDIVLVSVDDHVVEPPDLFEGRLASKYVEFAPEFITNPDGTKRVEVQRRDPHERRAECGCRPAQGGVRDRADVVHATAARKLRPQRTREGHERQRRAGVVVLPVVPAVLRTAFRPYRRQGRRAGDGAGVQRLAHRRVVWAPPGSVHSVRAAGDVGPRGLRR